MSSQLVRLESTADLPEEVLWSLAAALDADALLPWTVEHAAAGDPLPAAWAACANDHAMFNVILAAGYHYATGLCAECDRDDSPRDAADTCAGCVAHLRAVLPALTLADVVARRTSPR